MKMRSLFVLILAVAAPLFAQDKPNSMGVSFHHISFVVPDYDANIDFWTKFGGTQQPMQGRTRFSAFHFTGEDVVVSVMENKSNSGGSVGSVIDHIGFQVPDVPAAVAKWKAAGLKTEAGRNDQQAYVYTPDDGKIEILQDATLKVPLKPHHVHFFTAAPLEMQAWYANMFGAIPGKRGPYDDATVPNMDLTFAKADGALAPTKGRALDHIGFAVVNLEQAKKDLEAKGVNFDPALQPPAGRGPGSAQIAFLIDPWGTQVELIQVAPAGQ
jgi:catechol 2,3-dioxygenase-like lactoylglutathione lyase family enzyme